ncbi:MAG: NAD-dependent epimerase/dehydratase family protein [Polyangia bacterium]
MPADRKRVPKKKALVTRPPYDPEQRVVAVTGAHSFIGSELIKRLERDRRYYKVLAIDIRKPTFAMSKTQFHKIDLTMPTADADLAAVWKREGVDTVVHAAFLSTPTHANAWAHELESIGTMHVLNACAETAVRKLVVWSQTVVYGAHPLNPNFLTEEHELRGHVSRSRFVKDKVEVERQVRRFASEHEDTIVTTLRTAATLGPHIRNFATRFFARPIAPTLMGYDPLMQLVHERDVVDAFTLAVDNDFPGEFNIVGEGVLPYSTILAMMGKVPLPMPHFLARPLSRALWATQIFDSPPNFLDFLRFLCVADGSKARRVMGFQPVYDLKATIHDFLGVGAPMIDNGGRLQQPVTGGV